MGQPAQGCPISIVRIGLEVKPPTELQGARTSRWRVRRSEARDVTEGRATHRYIRIIQQRVIQHIEGLRPELELALLVDMESTEQAGVDLRNARSTKLIAVRIAQVRSDNGARRCRCTVCRLVRVCKRRRIEPGVPARDRRATATRVATQLTIRFDQV